MQWDRCWPAQRHARLFLLSYWLALVPQTSRCHCGRQEARHLRLASRSNLAIPEKILLDSHASVLLHSSDHRARLLLGWIVEKCMVCRDNVPLHIHPQRHLVGQQRSSQIRWQAIRQVSTHLLWPNISHQTVVFLLQVYQPIREHVSRHLCPRWRIPQLPSCELEERKVGWSFNWPFLFRLKVFPWDYKTAELGNYRMNFTTAFIDFFAKIGWAYDLKTVSDEIIQKRVERTGDGSHTLWGYGDPAQNEEEKNMIPVLHKKED